MFYVGMNLAKNIAKNRAHKNSFLIKALRENLSESNQFKLKEETIKFINIFLFIHLFLSTLQRELVTSLFPRS